MDIIKEPPKSQSVKSSEYALFFFFYFLNLSFIDIENYFLLSFHLQFFIFSDFFFYFLCNNLIWWRNFYISLAKKNIDILHSSVNFISIKLIYQFFFLNRRQVSFEPLTVDAIEDCIKDISAFEIMLGNFIVHNDLTSKIGVEKAFQLSCELIAISDVFTRHLQEFKKRYNCTLLSFNTANELRLRTKNVKSSQKMCQCQNVPHVSFVPPGWNQCAEYGWICQQTNYSKRRMEIEIKLCW